MDVWQFNAWCKTWEARASDELALLIQAAYYGAYWNNAGKKGRSLQSVLRSLRPKQERPREKIDKDKVADKFRQFEELKKYGRTRVERN